MPMPAMPRFLWRMLPLLSPPPTAPPSPCARQTGAVRSPDTGTVPFTRVNLYARLKGYEQIENEDVQVFPDTTTNQNLEMIPISELPDQWDRREFFLTPSQNL